MKIFCLKSIFILAAIMAVWMLPEATLAQGQIYGLVENSDGTVPTYQALMFFGYTNSTDDEIHLSGSVGADYDEGHWFDDFQNFQFAPAGADYTYNFFDTIKFETAIIDSLISIDGFQEHNISLSLNTWPEPPVDVKLARSEAGEIHLRWTAAASASVHIYRRTLPSAGSFFRIDDPAGVIIGSGITTGQFHDSNTTYETGYNYLLLTVDQTGLFSAPVIFELAPAFCCGYYSDGFPGNTNADEEGLRDLADIVALIDRVYISKNLLWCHPDGNTNSDLEQMLDLADITKLIDLIYLTKEELLPCAS